MQNNNLNKKNIMELNVNLITQSSRVTNDTEATIQEKLIEEDFIKKESYILDDAKSQIENHHISPEYTKYIKTEHYSTDKDQNFSIEHLSEFAILSESKFDNSSNTDNSIKLKESIVDLTKLNQSAKENVDSINEKTTYSNENILDVDFEVSFAINDLSKLKETEDIKDFIDKKEYRYFQTSKFENSTNIVKSENFEKSEPGIQLKRSLRLKIKKDLRKSKTLEPGKYEISDTKSFLSHRQKQTR